MRGETGEHMAVIFYRKFDEVKDAVGDSEFQMLDEFFCMEPADSGKIGAGRNFEIDNL